MCSSRRANGKSAHRKQRGASNEFEVWLGRTPFALIMGPLGFWGRAASGFSLNGRVCVQECLSACVCESTCVWQANEENIRGNQMEYIFRQLIDINSHLFAGKRTNYTHNGVPGSPNPGLGQRQLT